MDAERPKDVHEAPVGGPQQMFSGQVRGRHHPRKTIPVDPVFLQPDNEAVYVAKSGDSKCSFDLVGSAVVLLLSELEFWTITFGEHFVLLLAIKGFGRQLSFAPGVVCQRPPTDQVASGIVS